MSAVVEPHEGQLASTREQCLLIAEELVQPAYPLIGLHFQEGRAQLREQDLWPDLVDLQLLDEVLTQLGRAVLRNVSAQPCEF